MSINTALSDGIMLISEHHMRLLALLADGQFHSGTELAGVLAVSRTAIWKHLQAMADCGVEVVAVTGKGYKLQTPLQLLDREEIVAHLDERTGALINRMEIHAVIHSTNAHLSEIARTTHVSGQVCLAEYQTAGKGRRGRNWVSPFGHNIYLSILWRYSEGPAAIAGLSLAIGVAVIRALRRAGVDEVGLKWPNDVYWNGRKLAGILIEVSGEAGGPCHAVIGLGLNIHLPQRQAEAIEQAWVDLQQILGFQALQLRNRLAAGLLNEMMPIVADFDSLTLANYLDEWRTYDCMQGRAVTMFIGGQRVDGTVKGIDDRGLLLLEEADGRIRAYASGEVSYRAS
ncbi:MAG: bifunctional biotin--[acetyl-CoA-carboxylase] ligase/biotin operon repressor BirA [Methylomonas sp.]|nr:bifunctional biotin--[acetyl-CoA-carboxylase] ligase/biotin operon repressor BirA [Methylomonas sp.]